MGYKVDKNFLRAPLVPMERQASEDLRSRPPPPPPGSDTIGLKCNCLTVRRPSGAPIHQLHMSSEPDLEGSVQAITNHYAPDPASAIAELRSCWAHPNADQTDWGRTLADLMGLMLDVVRAPECPVLDLGLCGGLQHATYRFLEELQRHAASEAPSDLGHDRMHVREDQFLTFRADRFRFEDYRPEPMQDWLWGLVSNDPHKRFTEPQITQLLDKWTARVASGAQSTTPEDVLDVVRATSADKGVELAPKVEQDILALPMSQVAVLAAACCVAVLPVHLGCCAVHGTAFVRNLGTSSPPKDAIWCYGRSHLLHKMCSIEWAGAPDGFPGFQGNASSVSTPVAKPF